MELEKFCECVEEKLLEKAKTQRYSPEKMAALQDTAEVRKPHFISLSGHTMNLKIPLTEDLAELYAELSARIFSIGYLQRHYAAKKDLTER
ncbi:unnamed protein product [marine sediment metagenome]|uniref:Uncharacterized protein n=1 Tax=marine sediment metagenome TaxID=412755 RepID=X1B3F2_9ZZZZ